MSWACETCAMQMGFLVLLSSCQAETPLRTALLVVLQQPGFSPGQIQKQKTCKGKIHGASHPFGTHSAKSLLGDLFVIYQLSWIVPTRECCHLGQAVLVRHPADHPLFLSPSSMGMSNLREVCNLASVITQPPVEG